jgi:hypothetical protein
LLYLIALVSCIMMVWLEGLYRMSAHLLTVPALIIVSYVFYYTGLLHGGADAKAFMSLAILLPFYPVLEGLPLIQYDQGVFEVLELTFPFAFLVLMNAAIIQVITVPLALLVKNIIRRDFGFPEMLLGYRMDLREVPRRFVWPMETVQDDEVVLQIFPKRNADLKSQLSKLQARGIKRIWVTQKIPFMVPMVLGLVFSLVVGNVILLFF